MVADVAPGDRVRIRPTGRRAGVERGQLLEVLSPSPQRQKPRCEVAGRCGGCAWQHISLTTQQQTKADVAARALGPDAAALKRADAAPEWAYRRRVRLHMRQDRGGTLLAGFMGRASDELVAVTSCPVLVPALAERIEPLRRWLQGFVEQAEVHATAGVEGVICAVTARPRTGSPPPPLHDDVASQLGVVGLTLHFGSRQLNWGLSQVTLPETRTGLAIEVDGAGFCQASAQGNAALRDVVSAEIDACGPLQGCQEFFSGSGNLSALLHGRVERVLCVEQNEAAVARARSSLGRAELTQFRMIADDAAEAARPPSNPELWLLDPGRPGAAELCRRATKLAPDCVIYASCAANTLSRDLAILRAGGFAIRSATWLDTAPHTPHFEMVVRLGRGDQLPAPGNMP